MQEPFHNPWTKRADSFLSRTGASIVDGLSKSTNAATRTIGDTWRQMREDAPEANPASRVAFWLADGVVNTGAKGFDRVQKGMEKTLDAYVPKGEGVRYSDGRNRRAQGQGPNWAQAVDGAKGLWAGTGQMALAGASVVPIRMGGNLASQIIPRSVPRFLGGGGARTLGEGMVRWSPRSRTAGRWSMNFLGNAAEAAFSPGVSASRLANWAATKGGTNPFVRSVDWLFNKAPVLRHLKRLGQRTVGNGEVVPAPYGAGITRRVWKSFGQKPFTAIPTHLGKSIGSSLLGPGNLLFIDQNAKMGQKDHDSYYGERDDWGRGRSLAASLLEQAPYLIANSAQANLAAELFDRYVTPRISNDPTGITSWGQRILTPTNRDRIPAGVRNTIAALPEDLRVEVAHRGAYSQFGQRILAALNYYRNLGIPPEQAYELLREQLNGPSS